MGHHEEPHRGSVSSPPVPTAFPFVLDETRALGSRKPLNLSHPNEVNGSAVSLTDAARRWQQKLTLDRHWWAVRAESSTLEMPFRKAVRAKTAVSIDPDATPWLLGLLNTQHP